MITWLGHIRRAFLLALAMVFALCLGTSTLVAAPFNDALSEAIEIREQGRTAPPFSMACRG